ncbi:MAG: flagellar assembly protein FliH [Sulfurimonas sp.]|nr:flagellar assembly protein FliH [Sulfurimonas sp.]PHQ90570.1 MAG: flagellar assembly protein FliH [Sulfurimonas sp.]
MKSVIKQEKLVEHSISKYNFSVFSWDSNSFEEDESMENYSSENNPKRRNNTQRRKSDVDSSSMTTSSKEALIESLMKKTDEMSSNFIKLQMKLEAKEEEYKLELEKNKETAYAEGLEAGQLEASQNSQTDLSNTIEQFATSVVTLETTAKEFKLTLEEIKSDLVSAALDISKEVIKVELTQNSAKVAQELSDSLIKELQGAATITLKVNPKDHGVISEHVGALEHIQLISDSAVSEGGVIAMSDVGNIDSQISKRFERVKKTALSE